MTSERARLLAQALRSAASYLDSGRLGPAAYFIEKARDEIAEALEASRSVPAPRVTLTVVQGGARPEHISKPIARVLEQIKPKGEE